ncbi:SecY-interacting protein [Thalassotalea sp. LPB0316]|uniref:SecY-interacting protein n=1 Tax=Thalassotalea sp. LPB0316 TaxID=2769490 RepID=UPI001868AAB4|nr:SecY-interacting protein [Thalassotalea sp. LPB0316]QOL24539.1 SecY-interacting protein [Thalassotalea sp. LPB0316]
MKSSNPLFDPIMAFANNFVSQCEQVYGHKPYLEKDDEWPSPCLCGERDQQNDYWQPVAIEEALSFSNVEEALDIKLHQSIIDYYTAIYSEPVPAQTDDGLLELLFAWNLEDFERLQRNIIGHVLMKQKLNQPVTIFFAVTDQEDIILSVDNESGEVWAEKVGKLPHKKVANSLSEFIELIDNYVAEPQ